MTEAHVILIAALLALAVVLGTVAATRTVSLGRPRRPRAPPTLDRAPAKKLDAFEASLDRALAEAAGAAGRAAAGRRHARAARRLPPPAARRRHERTRADDDEGTSTTARGGRR